jgi:hypothetical protein
MRAAFPAGAVRGGIALATRLWAIRQHQRLRSVAELARNLTAFLAFQAVTLLKK